MSCCGCHVMSCDVVGVMWCDVVSCCFLVTHSICIPFMCYVPLLVVLRFLRSRWWMMPKNVYWCETIEQCACALCCAVLCCDSISCIAFSVQLSYSLFIFNSHSRIYERVLSCAAPSGWMDGWCHAETVTHHMHDTSYRLFCFHRAIQPRAKRSEQSSMCQAIDRIHVHAYVHAYICACQVKRWWW